MKRKKTKLLAAALVVCLAVVLALIPMTAGAYVDDVETLSTFDLPDEAPPQMEDSSAMAIEDESSRDDSIYYYDSSVQVEPADVLQVTPVYLDNDTSEPQKEQANLVPAGERLIQAALAAYASPNIGFRLSASSEIVSKRMTSFGWDNPSNGVTTKTTYTWPTGSSLGFTRYGYTVKGWTNTVGGSLIWTAGSTTTFTATYSGSGGATWDYTLSPSLNGATASGYAAVFYPVWEPNGEVYAIKYDPGIGSGGKTVSVTPEKSHTVYNASEANVSLHGYTLTGWATSAGGSVVYSVGNSFTPTKSMTLYAVWAHDNATFYTISYDANGGTGGSMAKVVPGQSHTILTKDQAEVGRDGHTLAGWATSPSGDVGYTAGQDITPTSNMELYAVWQQDGSYYDIVYDANGGEGGTTAKVIPTYTHGVYTAQQANVTKYAFVLQGWATTSTGEVVYPAGQTITPTGSMKLYAVWKHDGETYHIITYNAGDGEGGSTAKVIPGEPHTVYTADKAAVSLRGHVLVGWATNPDGEVEYTAGEQLFVSSSQELYARWEHDGELVTVTYNAAEGEGGTSLQLLRDSEHVIYSAADAQVSYYGHGLVGWATVLNGDVAYLPGEEIQAAEDTTLYAVWEPCYSPPPPIDEILEGAREVGGDGIPGSKIVVAWPDGGTSETIVNDNGRWKVKVPDTVNLKAGDIVTATQQEPGKLVSKQTQAVVQPVAGASSSASQDTRTATSANVPQTGDSDKIVYFAVTLFALLAMVSILLLKRAQKKK